jgi:excisionase family DNA binding protein
VNGHAIHTPLCVDVREAARLLGVSAWTVREYVATGDLPIVKLPATKGTESRSRRVLIAVEDLKAFVERCRA